MLRGCSKQNYRENYWVLLNKRKRNSVLYIFRLALIGLQTTGPRPQLFKRWIVLDSAIHRINLYPLDSPIIGFPKYLSTLFIWWIVLSSFWTTGARSVNGSVNSKHAHISGAYKSHIDYVNISFSTLPSCILSLLYQNANPSPYNASPVPWTLKWSNTSQSLTWHG